jgi:transposase-like protein
MQRRLTIEQVRAYATDSNKCPYCASTNYDGDSGEFGDNAGQELTCHDCGRTWTDVYALVRIVDDNGQVYNLTQFRGEK